MYHGLVLLRGRTWAYKGHLELASWLRVTMPAHMDSATFILFMILLAR